MVAMVETSQSWSRYCDPLDELQHRSLVRGDRWIFRDLLLTDIATQDQPGAVAVGERDGDSAHGCMNCAVS